MAMPHILVVEADASMRCFIHEVLSDQGCQVEFAEPHRLPWSHLAEPPWVDLMLIDVPPIESDQAFSLLHALRDQASTANLPVVVYSTDPKLLTELDHDRGRLQCVTLQKPFDLDAFLHIIGEQLGGASAGYRREHCRTAAL